MATRMLWRLEGVRWETLDDPVKLAEGMALHLDHADLLMVLMQVGEKQQAYLALTPCRGCALGRCQPACPRDLLRRMLSKRFAVCELRSVPRGLATRPYQRFLAATPAQHARLLDGQLLSAWPEGRLIVHWRTAARRVRAGAVLAVGTDGPDPAEKLRTYGWQASRFHAPAARTIALAPIPSALPASAVWRRPVLPLLPGVPPEMQLPAVPRPPARTHRWSPVMLARPWLWLSRRDASSEQSPAKPQTVDRSEMAHSSTAYGDSNAIAAHQNGAKGISSLTQTLAPAENAPVASTSPLAVLLDRALAAGREPRRRTTPGAMLTHQAASDATGAQPPDEQGTIWPAGPGRMRPALVEALIKRLLSDPAILGATPPGLTKNRLKPLIEGPLVEPLLVWLDAAEVLTEPSKPEVRWREPRVLRSADLAWIAERLRATPLPDAAAVRAAFGGKS
jgi:hypothetical protein